MRAYYTIPRTTRELQHQIGAGNPAADYTIPRTTRELQPLCAGSMPAFDYTIPRTTRELQPAGHPCFGLQKLYHTKNYQGTTTEGNGRDTPWRLYHTKNYQGTTTGVLFLRHQSTIIPYQELPGNYNLLFKDRPIH